jgi:hypothetical protein
VIHIHVINVSMKRIPYVLIVDSISICIGFAGHRMTNIEEGCSSIARDLGVATIACSVSAPSRGHAERSILR